MPELPEVETVRRQLARSLVGCIITGVERVEPSMLLGVTPATLAEELAGARVLGVCRRGKFLLVKLHDEAYLTLHLGMTGQILLTATCTGWGPHDRFVLTLSSEAEPQPDGGPQDDEDHSEPCAHPGREEHKEAPAVLVFRDIRKFGRVEFGRGAPPARVTRLGRDAWVGEWGPEYVAACLHGRRAPIKAVLLDQRHLAGIGNIYADEILFAASLSPLREAGGLNEEEVERLAVAIRERLTEGVRARGCSISDFVDTQERPGTYQEVLQAYGRGGEPCARCNGTLQRTVVAGRGTSYCPACQR